VLRDECNRKLEQMIDDDGSAPDLGREVDGAMSAVEAAVRPHLPVRPPRSYDLTLGTTAAAAAVDNDRCASLPSARSASSAKEKWSAVWDPDESAFKWVRGNPKLGDVLELPRKTVAAEVTAPEHQPSTYSGWPSLVGDGATLPETARGMERRQAAVRDQLDTAPRQRSLDGGLAVVGESSCGVSTPGQGGRTCKVVPSATNAPRDAQTVGIQRKWLANCEFSVAKSEASHSALASQAEGSANAPPKVIPTALARTRSHRSKAKLAITTDAFAATSAATERSSYAPQPRALSASLTRERQHRDESRTATPSCSSNGAAHSPRGGEGAVPLIATAALAAAIEGSSSNAPQPRVADWLKARVARRRLKTAGNKIRKLSMATSLIKMGCLAGCSAPAGGAQRKSMTLSTIKSQSEAAKAAAQDSEDKLDDLDRIRLQVERSSTQDRPLWRPRERPQRIVPFAAESEVNGEHPCHAQLRWLSANEDHPLENAPLELSEHAHGTTDESRTTAIVPGAADRRLSRDGTRTHQLRAKLQKFPSQHVTTACAPNAKASMRQLRTKDDVLQQMHAKLQQMRARNAQAPRHTWSAGKDVLSGSATPSSSSNSAACPARDGERPVAPIAAAAAMAAMQPTIAKATEATEGIGCAPQPRPQSAALLRARRHREESRTATPSCSSNGTACPAREGERAVPSIAAAAATAMQPTIAEGVEGNGCAPQPRPLGASLARARRHRDESRTATPSCSSNGTAC